MKENLRDLMSTLKLTLNLFKQRKLPIQFGLVKTLIIFFLY